MRLKARPQVLQMLPMHMLLWTSYSERLRFATGTHLQAKTSSKAAAKGSMQGRDAANEHATVHK
jgi:hypothetical protein